MESELKQQELVKLHNIIIFLNSSCILTYLLMSIKMEIGLVAFIGIILLSKYIEKKKKAIGAKLSPDNRKKMYWRQIQAYLVLFLPVFALLIFPLPPSIPRIIIMSFLVGFVMLACTTTYFEYMGGAQDY